MNILTALYNIIISPIESIIETTFWFELAKIGILSVGGAIIAVSLVMNFLALPIYIVADRIQERERRESGALQHWVTHIQKNFTGDERFMMTQYYYKIMGYHPLYALRSSLSILIEIPFFIAAYHFLSHCTALKGASFAFLSDLGCPDKLLKLWGVEVNILPIIMTAVNIISAAIYLRGFSLREKAQTYALAAIFLVLLYNSPSGLVFYWILNNLFSLAKNIVIKYCKKPAAFTHRILTVLLFAISAYLITVRADLKLAKRLLVSAFTLLFAITPLFIKLGKHLIRATQAKHITQYLSKNKSKTITKIRKVDTTPLFALFIASALGLSLLLGLVLPSSVIATDVREFSYIGEVANPIGYIFQNLFTFIGLFLVWPLIIYKMFGDKTKKTLTWGFVATFIITVLNVYVFGFVYGNMDMFFTLDDRETLLTTSLFYTLLPFVALLIVSVLLYLTRRFKTQIVLLALIVICLAEGALSGTKLIKIQKDFTEYSKIKRNDNITKIEPVYHLSKTGKNVVVLFLDRAISSFFPYIVKQFPTLAKDFEGFKYYPNTVSFASQTFKASCAMMGGYEYTPEAMNERPKEKLIDKQNEAILVMPKLFSDAGYDATVTDPPNEEFMGEGEGSLRSKFPQIKFDYICGKYGKFYNLEALDKNGANNKVVINHLKAFCAMEAMFPILRNTFYNDSFYFQERFSDSELVTKYFAHIYFLDKLTDATAKKDTFTFIGSLLTHTPFVLKEPEFVPGPVDRDKATAGFYQFERPANAGRKSDLAHYHVNAAAILQTAKWLNHLKTLGVYDNTRVVIVSDHGRNIPVPAFHGMEHRLDYAAYNVLLMEKDFNAHGEVQTDMTFMTNADTVYLAKKGMGISEENPFTHKKFFNTLKKDRVHVYPSVVSDTVNEVNMNNGCTWITDNFPPHPQAPEYGYEVGDNIFIEDNWKIITHKK